MVTYNKRLRKFLAFVLLNSKCNCINCIFNEASNEPHDSIGYCDIFDIEFVNSESKRCREYKPRLSEDCETW